tara:strand:+ start:1338 stop:1580 length:243 start_codon:yes stop_codon:yes gene_type:complete
MLTENSTKKITKMDLIIKGSLAAAIITIPTLIVFFGVWTITNDLLYGAIAGLIANFIALGAAFKIVSKKFTPNKKDNLEL